MRRREALSALMAMVAMAGAAASTTVHGSERRIGYLDPGADFAKRKTPSPNHEAFLKGLAGQGLVPGRNLVVEYRFAEGRNDRLPALAAELVERKVEVVFGWADAARATARATRSIPVVFTAIADPVIDGLVQSLANPGGNVTGFSNQGLELDAKRLELLKAAVPSARRVAILADINHSQYEQQRSGFEAAARSLGLELRFVEVKGQTRLPEMFSAIRSVRPDALLVQERSVFNFDRRGIAAAALEGRLPAMFEHADFVRAGGLLSYGPDFVDVWRRAGDYVGRILKVADPAALPVQQPTKFELMVNRRTAREIGIDVPQSVRLRADRVIE
ncbi:MAG: ABC transporter substrate-binding protein [Betaproteobacteria bacterium]|nr:ABC transporter substrate-binding protein [Betaproteobacteria bacterium]